MVFSFLFVLGCTSDRAQQGTAGTTSVFKHGKIAGDPAGLRKLLDRFEQESPGIHVKDETLPASTDEQHQFYAINLDSRSADFDVLSLDVIWVPEFARAGWLRDVTAVLAQEERHAFFSGPIEAVTYEGRLFAVPWYIDAGLLYYRSDLLKKYGRPVPRTWQELVSTAREITAAERNLYGFLWQGKENEGLGCNVFELLWSNGGAAPENGRTAPETRQEIGAPRCVGELIGQNGATAHPRGTAALCVEHIRTGKLGRQGQSRRRGPACIPGP